MDFEQVKNNLMNALSQLLVLRVIVTSPSEKIADIPALFALLCVLMAPVVCAAVVILGLLTRHAVRFEKDVSRM